jgi:hypothetical protein
MIRKSVQRFSDKIMLDLHGRGCIADATAKTRFASTTFAFTTMSRRKGCRNTALRGVRF